MSTFQKVGEKMTNFRWIICGLLFFATTVNYLDRQVLSLTWKDFIAPEFHWTDSNYGDITAIFSIVYAIANLFAGRFIDWMGTKKGYLWAIFVWSLGACLHALCGWATEETLGIHNAEAELGTIALLSNITREIITLLFAPLLVRWFGNLAPISAGGATTMDTTLPIITRYSGQSFVVVSIFHGFVVDFSVPFLVTLFCSI